MAAKTTQPPVLVRCLVCDGTGHVKQRGHQVTCEACQGKGRLRITPENKALVRRLMALK